jgi:hypothetical protein
MRRRRPKKRLSKKRDKDRSSLVTPVCIAAVAGLAGAVAFGFPEGAVAGPAAVAAWEAASAYKAVKLNKRIQKRTSTPKFSQVKSEAKKAGVRIVGEPGSHAKKLAAGILARMVLTGLVCVAACASLGLAQPKNGYAFGALAGVAAGVVLAVVFADPRGEAWGKTRGGISAEINAVVDCLSTGCVAVIVVGFVPKRKFGVIGDIDIVVVLQDGHLVAIEVKSGSGSITENGDQILVAGRTLPGRPAVQSAQAGEVLSQQTGRPVQSVLYLPRGSASTRSRTADTAIVGGPQNLSRALGASHLDPAAVKAAAKSIGVKIR